MDALLQGLSDEWTGLVRLTPRIVAALLVLVVALWIGRLVGRVVEQALRRGRLSRTHLDFFRHLVTWVFVILGIGVGLNLLGLRAAATGLLAGGGITAVTLGFAFRGIGENFLAGFFLAFSRPFELGDFIQSGEFQGVVRGIEMRCTHIRTGDGRDVYIPSAQIFNQPVVNFTRDGLRRLAFVVGIDYGDDTEAARRTLLDAVQQAQGVLDDPPAAVSVSKLLAQYQELEASFWIDVFKPGISLNVVRSDVMGRCRRALVDGGFTVSSNVTTAITIDEPSAVDVRIAEGERGRA